MTPRAARSEKERLPWLTGRTVAHGIGRLYDERDGSLSTNTHHSNASLSPSSSCLQRLLLRRRRVELGKRWRSSRPWEGTRLQSPLRRSCCFSRTLPPTVPPPFPARTYAADATPFGAPPRRAPVLRKQRAARRAFLNARARRASTRGDLVFVNSRARRAVNRQ